METNEICRYTKKNQVKYPKCSANSVVIEPIQLYGGLVALAAGGAFYLLFRQTLITHPILALPIGTMLGSFPTFIHAFSFAVIMAAFLLPRKRNRILVCGLWLCIELLSEGMQSSFVKTRFLNPPSDIAIVRIAVQFGLRGTYDHKDAVAALIGAVLAYITLSMLHRKRVAKCEGTVFPKQTSRIRRAI